MARARAMPPAPAPVVVRTQTGTSGRGGGPWLPWPSAPRPVGGHCFLPHRVVWRGVWGQGGAAAPGPGRRARSSARAAPATPPRRGLYTPPVPTLPLHHHHRCALLSSSLSPHRELAARSPPPRRGSPPATPVTASPLTTLCLLGRAAPVRSSQIRPPLLARGSDLAFARSRPGSGRISRKWAAGSFGVL